MARIVNIVGVWAGELARVQNVVGERHLDYGVKTDGTGIRAFIEIPELASEFPFTCRAEINVPANATETEAARLVNRFIHDSNEMKKAYQDYASPRRVAMRTAAMFPGAVVESGTVEVDGQEFSVTSILPAQVAA